MIEYNDPTCATNLTASRPLHYLDISADNPFMEFAKDVSALKVLEHLEEAHNGGMPPDCESYRTAKAVIFWWSPQAFGRMRLRVERTITPH